MNIPFLDLTSYHQTIKDELMDKLESCYDANAFCLGEYVERFEQDLSAYTGIKHAIGVNSGTSALHLSLLALGVGPGDEVIVPAMTFISSAWGVCYCGATPVFADVEINSRNLSAQAVSDAITERTKAVIAVHLYGQPAEMKELRDVCSRHKIALIEDAAQALGAKYHNAFVGSWGDLTCLSFYPGKNLGGIGEGGAVLTNDQNLKEKIVSLRNHGTGTTRYIHERIGYNYRMDGLQAAALSVKLPHYDNRNEERRRAAARYASNLKEITNIKIPELRTDLEPIWHLYVILSKDRDRVAKELEVKGIHTGLHYPCPLHLQPCFGYIASKSGSYSNAEEIANSCLSLPMYPELESKSIDYICETVQEILR